MKLQYCKMIAIWLVPSEQLYAETITMSQKRPLDLGNSGSWKSHHGLDPITLIRPKSPPPSFTFLVPQVPKSL